MSCVTSLDVFVTRLVLWDRVKIREKNHLKVRFFSCNAGRGNCIRSGQKAVSERDSSLEPQFEERLRSFRQGKPFEAQNKQEAASKKAQGPRDGGAAFSEWFVFCAASSPSADIGRGCTVW